MFVGRIKEQEIILKTLSQPGNHILLYGNRRVGKTRLTLECAKKTKISFINYECIKDSLEKNILKLTNMLYELGIINVRINFSSFEDLFNYINSLKKRIIILIDEYPYLYFKINKEVVDSIFQNVIDNYSSNINIILSGSHIGMMKNLVYESSPLFGRFKTYMHLQELSYLEASEFYPNLSNYDKAAFYSIFGGSPFILEQLDYTKDIEYNIKNTFLNQSSSIYMFVSEGYTTDITTKANANIIFSTLSNSIMRYKKIEERLNIDNNGLLNKQLKTLIDMNFIEKNIPINKKDDNKKTTYSIKNNALRFYFTYVYDKSDLLYLLGEDTFYTRYIEQSINTFISYRFESICKSFISELAKRNIIKNINNIGSYYYDDKTTKTNGEFDIAIETNNGYDIIEVKYLQNKLNNKQIQKEIEQINNIKELKIDKVGFISINGFEDNTIKLDYMYDGNDIYFITQ